MFQFGSKKMTYRQVRKLSLLIGVFFLVSFPCLSVASDSAYWIYTVRKGDNLWSFSERHLISPAYASKLKTLNKISDPYNIRPDTKLKVPLQWGKRVESAATVLEFTGKVTIVVARGKPQPASIGLSLPSGSRVTTSKGSQATLKFVDGSHLILNSDTSIVLGKQVYYPTTNASTNTIDLEQGSVKGDIQHPPLMNNRYEIRTKTAVTAVKGTELDVSVDDSGATRTSVFSGVVDVSSGKNSVALEKGFGSLIANDQKDLEAEKLLSPPVLTKTQPTFSDNPPIISWNKLEGAEKYKVEVYSTKGRTDLLQVKSTQASEILLPVEKNGNYLVRVYGIPKSGLLGIPTEGKFSLDAFPLPPMQLSPSELDAHFSKKVSLNLGKAKEYKGYQLQYSRDQYFKSEVETIELGLDDPKFVVPESGVWYWRVASVNSKGEVGSYSTSNKLHVGALTVKNQQKSVLRVKPVELKGVTYRLDLTKQGTHSTPAYSRVQKQPKWDISGLPSGKYTAQIFYLFAEQVVFETYPQEIDR